MASIESAEVERLAEWPLVNGALGLRRVGCRSIANEELLRDLESKWPDRFSLNVAESENPESLREIGVVGGKRGNSPEIGDNDDGGLPLVDLLVDGRSTRVWSFFDCKKALNTKCFFAELGSVSPKVVEF